MTAWLSAVPEKCETCEGEIKNKFYDAATKQGPWACMCPACFNFGPGLGKLGLGKGQEYTKTVENDKIVYKKTGG